MQPSGVHRWCLLVCQMWLLAVAGGAGMEMQATWSSPDCIRIRQATLADVPHLQRINLVCLPENYNQQNFWFHILRWPTLIRVAEARVLRRNSSERDAADAGEDDAEWAVVAYVMAKIDDADDIDGRSQGSPASAHTARAVSSARREVKGHITSLAVMRSHRRLGLAKRFVKRVCVSLRCVCMGASACAADCGWLPVLILQLRSVSEFRPRQTDAGFAGTHGERLQCVDLCSARAVGQPGCAWSIPSRPRVPCRKDRTEILWRRRGCAVHADDAGVCIAHLSGAGWRCGARDSCRADRSNEFESKTPGGCGTVAQCGCDPFRLTKLLRCEAISLGGS